MCIATAYDYSKVSPYMIKSGVAYAYVDQMKANTCGFTAGRHGNMHYLA